ncbi:hypothetical protein ACIBM8_20505 [Micromonospora aurantiaca]|uniref:hypothetical protein n=1 Tax=Micromonospora aurantiaca (nom. illeg.) TaxID=47850 RepID=UPI0037B30461
MAGAAGRIVRGVFDVITAAVVAAAGLLVVPDPWPGLLGLLPIALGIRALQKCRQVHGQQGWRG